MKSLWRACRRCVPCLQMWLVSLEILGVGTSWGQTAYTPPDCGTKSLFLLLRLKNSRVGLDEVEKALPPRPEEGYSMAELQAAARKCGLDLTGERFDRSRIPLDRPVIAHLDRHKPDSGHFVVLRPVGTEGTVVQVIDPPYSPSIIGYPELLRDNRGMVRVLKPLTAFEQHLPLLLLIAPSVPIPFVIGFLIRRASVCRAEAKVARKAGDALTTRQNSSLELTPRGGGTTHRPEWLSGD